MTAVPPPTEAEAAAERIVALYDAVKAEPNRYREWVEVSSPDVLHALARALLAAVDRLTNEEVSHEHTIDERDRATEAADRLAYAIAPQSVIGEHTSENDPWHNALDALDALTAERDAAVRDAATAREALEAEAQERRDLAEALLTAREQRDDWQAQSIIYREWAATAREQIAGALALHVADPELVAFAEPGDPTYCGTCKRMMPCATTRALSSPPVPPTPAEPAGLCPDCLCDTAQHGTFGWSGCSRRFPLAALPAPEPLPTDQETPDA